METLLTEAVSVADAQRTMLLDRIRMMLLCPFSTELSFDYQLGLLFEENEIIEKIKKWNPCNCGSPKCRGTMMLL
jgi:hypothetical protein